jgi:ATP-dependent protease ClpP protease subunit
MRTLTGIILVVMGLASTNTSASVLTVDPERLVEIIDVVDGSIIGEAQKLDRLSRESKEPIYVLLNSPGGMTVPGFTFADALTAVRKRGVKVVCFSGVLAASMAFNLFAYCDERYALAHTKLLFHPVRLTARGGLTVAEMLLHAETMALFERRNQTELMKMMGVPADWFARHYHGETLWEAVDLAEASGNDWLTIVDDIEGAKNLWMIQRPQPFRLFEDNTAAEVYRRPILIQAVGPGGILQ